MIRMLKRTPSNSYIRIKSGSKSLPEVPEGMWRKCNKCGAPIYTEDVRAGAYICPKCGGYFRMHAYRRIELVADEGSFEEWDRGLPLSNPLGLSGYARKVSELKEKTGLDEAVITGKAKIGGFETVIGVMDGRFIMGSMGHNVGEKITRAFERAARERLPVILFCCSGGARMQEGIVSLMQMAKTAAAVKRHSDAGLLYISVLTEPTMGGVTASFAMLGDIILAEPGAVIGFAGPRVIEQTIGQKLPEGFQTAEFLVEHGFVDAIIRREESKAMLAGLLALHQPGRPDGAESGVSERFGSRRENEPDAWERVRLSRKKGRPTGLDYIGGIFSDFVELHGDRAFGDDQAVVGGIASLHGCPVTVIAQQKGRSTKENIERNFSMPSPEGYRKALRLMKQAEKFRRPVICFVDTPGAFCGMEAEERGQGEAIARNLLELSSLKTPVLSVVIGEGGSGGALALAAGDEVWMLENAVYSVLSPEGFASIVWKDSKRADEAARIMGITARELKEMGVVEQVIPEEEPADRKDCKKLCRRLEQEICGFLERYGRMTPEELIERRYKRFRSM